MRSARKNLLSFRGFVRPTRTPIGNNSIYENALKTLSCDRSWVSPMAIGRKKYMDASEVRQLRTNTEGRGLRDLKKGRVNGVVQWMLVDLALSTGLRVSEMAALKVEDLDLKRGCMTVIRLKRHRKRKSTKSGRRKAAVATESRKPTTETLMIGKQLVSHLKTYLTWRSCRIADMDENRRRDLSDESGALLVGQRGTLGAQGLQQIWKAAIRWSGLPA
jgi:integrase